jgi:hypothetical protein
MKPQHRVELDLVRRDPCLVWKKSKKPIPRIVAWPLSFVNEETPARRTLRRKRFARSSFVP